MAGIVGYGAFVPRKRIKSEEIARQWGKDPATIRRGLLLEEKTVPGLDEDTITSRWRRQERPSIEVASTRPE